MAYLAEKFVLPTITSQNFAQRVGLGMPRRRRMGKPATRSVHSPVAKMVRFSGYQTLPGFMTHDMAINSPYFAASGYTAPPPPPKKKSFLGCPCKKKRKSGAGVVTVGGSRSIVGPVTVTGSRMAVSGGLRGMGSIDELSRKAYAAKFLAPRLRLSGMGRGGFVRRRMRGFGQSETDLLNTGDFISSASTTDLANAGLSAEDIAVLNAGGVPADLGESLGLPSSASGTLASVLNEINTGLSAASPLLKSAFTSSGQSGVITNLPAATPLQTIPWTPILLGVGLFVVGAAVLKKH